MERAPSGSGSPPASAKLPLALTLAARVCHDLASTVGALAGTLDMALEAADPEALALAVACARELSARLRLLRAAWSMDAEIPDLHTLAAGLPGTERLTVDLSGLPPQLGPDQRRMVPNLLLLAAQGLPRGGTIHVSGERAGISARIIGTRAGWPACLSPCLVDPDALEAACRSTRDVGVAVFCLLATVSALQVTVHDAANLSLNARPS